MIPTEDHISFLSYSVSSYRPFWEYLTGEVNNIRAELKARNPNKTVLITSINVLHQYPDRVDYVIVWGIYEQSSR